MINRDNGSGSARAERNSFVAAASSRKRGSGLSMMGRSPGNISGRVGGFGYPHSVMRVRKQCRLIRAFLMLTRLSGLPVLGVGCVDNHRLNASMWLRSRSAQDATSG
jgi:hypothetical protein